MMVSMPNKIPDSIINEVRRSNDIVHIVGEYVQLKKQGRNYFGLCPFHEEKTPSFSVSHEKQIFHCFGCGKGGNVISFLMEIENFTFYESLRHLANRSGIDIPLQATETVSSQSEDENTLLNASEWLAKYYHHLLKYTEEGRRGLEYFERRGIAQETIDTFQLGFAPLHSDVTVQFLKEKGFHEQSLVKVGILNRTDSGDLIDPFRGRVIFPIKDHLGNTVAFGGRAIDDIQPKYLNSPDNELFHKGSMFYNFHLAKQPIRKKNEVIVFEGYMDVLSAYQAGIMNSIATLGTAFTSYQARLLGRYVDSVILCYDGDQAGIDATYEASLTLQKYRNNVKIARIDNATDPDSYIRQYGGKQFEREIIEKSATFTTFYMNYQKDKYNLTIESEKVAYLNKIMKHIATIESPIEREYYVQQLSDEFHITVETLNEEINRYRKENQSVHFKDKTNVNRYTNKATNTFPHHTLLPAYHNAERYLLAHMLVNNYVIEKVQEQLGISFNLDEHKVIAIHLYALFEENNEIDISSLIDRLDNDNERALVTQLINLPINEDVTDEEINDYINTIRKEHTTITQLNELKRKQRQAIKQNDYEEALKLAQEIIEMERLLKH